VSAVTWDLQAGQDPQFGSLGTEGIMNGNLDSIFMKRQSKETKEKALISF